MFPFYDFAIWIWIFHELSRAEEKRVLGKSYCSFSLRPEVTYALMLKFIGQKESHVSTLQQGWLRNVVFLCAREKERNKT